MIVEDPTSLNFQNREIFDVVIYNLWHRYTAQSKSRVYEMLSDLFYLIYWTFVEKFNI